MKKGQLKIKLLESQSFIKYPSILAVKLYVEFDNALAVQLTQQRLPLTGSTHIANAECDPDVLHIFVADGHPPQIKTSRSSGDIYHSGGTRFFQNIQMFTHCHWWSDIAPPSRRLIGLDFFGYNTLACAVHTQCEALEVRVRVIHESGPQCAVQHEAEDST